MLGSVVSGAFKHAEAEECDGGTNGERSNEAKELADGSRHSEQDLEDGRTHDGALDLHRRARNSSDPLRVVTRLRDADLSQSSHPYFPVLFATHDNRLRIRYIPDFVWIKSRRH